MKISSRDMNRIAGIIDRVVGELDVRAAAEAQRRIVRDEALRVREDLAAKTTKSAARLAASLDRLIALMDSQTAPVATAPKPKSALSWHTLLKAFAVLAGSALLATPAMAAPQMGDTVNLPGGVSGTVVETVPEGFVIRTADEREFFVISPPAIGTRTVVGGELDGSGNLVHLYDTVIGYQNSNGDRVTDVSWVNGYPADLAGNPITGVVYGDPAGIGSPEIVRGTLDVTASLGGGIDPVDASVPSDANDRNRHIDVRRASNGSNGSDGALVIPAKSGGTGKNGTNIVENLIENDSVISVGNQAPGYIIASVGGNGGKGGDAYLSAVGGGKSGGRGGSGGNVNVTLGGTGTIETQGNQGHGVVLQSRAGQGGKGGKGWASTGGSGAGGNAASGGSVVATVDLEQITTFGTGSHGILAQSLGGGAGNSGSSYGLFGSAADGGWGGHGGSVELNSGSNIYTQGDASYGILAQSIGGAGGDAGASGGIVSFGGSGGNAGDGGAVTVNVTAGRVETAGSFSYGVVAQSIGGAGGNAGSSSGIVGLGANGANGGNAGAVSVVTHDGSLILTGGLGATGIVAQSIGGGGGNAGVSAGLVAVGGSGTGGGEAGTVEVTHGGALQTEAAAATGILAQSIGGGGGTGRGTGGLIALGGKGGSGNDGKEVTVTVDATGTILTKGAVARGIVAQSIGGGGGDAGTTGGLVSLGGDGSAGGSAGDVTVNQGGVIDTRGIASDAILAQSIGGGGGAGGASGGFISLGGNGSSGGDGGSVTVTNSNRILTDGTMSRGIVAQSIGGGGGSAGAGGGVFAASGSGGHGGNASIGGSSSVKSDGGAVTVGNSGQILTQQDLSTAILAQSIGGGGGDGANSGGVFMAIGGDGGGGGEGGRVVVSNSGLLSTVGHDSHGILAQSIGGGGGNGGAAVSGGVLASVAVGGSGAGGGAGGQVDINQSLDADAPSTIVTRGDRSYGVLGQSIGGGGGNGGFGIATAVGVGAGVAVSLGGDGAGGGAGGLVNYTGYSRIETGAEHEGAHAGHNSTGILLQSIGGGGGNGGFSIANSVTALVGAAVSVGIGGAGGAGGAGGTINMYDAGGTILTHGDFASGLVAQSVGGGGGNGGYSIGTGIMGGAGVSVTATIGGSGGDGGLGGRVGVDYTGHITTHGLGSTGALLQSIGGGGGNGGFNIAAGVGAGAAPAITVGLGGSGGAGQHGGEVDGVVTGDISTFGDQASGFVAQSIGGGGGNGGYTVAGAVSAGIGGISVSVGTGGSGASGGDGGLVEGSVLGQIYTEGDQSTGFVAQSVGGGGGNGGYNVSGTVAAGLGGLAVSVGLGGDGAGGGTGGEVRATVGDLIHTKGRQSGGLVAQSIGGGGGNGGFNVSGSIAAGLGAGSVNVGLGGHGDGGGSGGSVTAISRSILTEGDGATGFLAQSIGGSGGAGGFNVSAGIAGGLGAGAINVGLGGNGAGGGDAGALVRAEIDGTVKTLGDLASAVVVQSLGGGGGSGGFNVSGGIGYGLGGGAIGVGLGGRGGGGGDGKAVEYAQTGSVLTEGLGSKGVVLQSVGGGGGDGAFNVTGGIAGGLGSGTVGFGLGGSGAGGGVGGSVLGELTGDVYTQGDLATGVLAQSVGGGGGSGGFNVTGGIAGGLGSGTINVGLGGSGAGGGDGGSVDFTQTGNTVTEGDFANAIVLQSIGGGGGDGGFNVSGGIGGGLGTGAINASVGGTAGSGGLGGLVSGKIDGTIITSGMMSTGLLAQSIGGGGGAGGFAVAGGIAGAGMGSGTINIGLGGSGGGGGNAGKVDLELAAAEIIDGLEVAVLTSGMFANGVVAQSIGGGGGAGGFNVTGGIAAAGMGAGTINVGIGGSGGDGGDADDVDVDIDGAVVTTGRGSTGVIAQSVGGGGGAGGFNVVGGVAAAGQGSGSAGLSLGGSGGEGGNAANVTLTHINGANAEGIATAVLTQADDSTGILAQSVGGGGGSGSFNINGGVGAAGQGSGAVGIGVGGGGGTGGSAGVVTADITGLVQTEGHNSRGVVAQSIGGGGGDGGLNVTGSVGAAGQGAGALTIGIGGYGAGGGDADDVILKAKGGLNAEGVAVAAITRGDNSTAFIAQSIGGGGGSGGMNISGSVSGASKGAGAATFGLGGSGGTGGAAGQVTADITGVILTEGQYSGAVLAQAIGGGGGAGGINVSAGASGTSEGSGNLVLGFGGAGGNGGSGGVVGGTVRSDIVTEGDNSFGLTYQSIGGGGGAGGMNVSAGASLGKSGTGNVVFGLGGSGGGGGHGALASLNYDGSIFTSGDFSHGILVQSAGGGGGSGGLNVSGGVAVAKENAGNLVIGVGGSGGGGGNASLVTGTLSGDVTTLGDNAYGSLLQSLGGGGGAGGINISGGVAGTTGAGMTGSLVIGVGGFGGDGGNAGAVKGDVAGNYLTKGDNSFGVGAQSVGGGGGAGGLNVAGSVSLSQGNTAAVAIGLGGFGGGGGDGAEVELIRRNDTQTEGANSDGVLVQSIGGGGGNGAINISGSFSDTVNKTSTALSFGLGGFGGDGGNAGDVTAKVHGNVWAKGVASDVVDTWESADGEESFRRREGGSNGVVVQSIGGGGGTGGINIAGSLATTPPQTGTARAITLGIGGFGGGGGSAGDVGLTVASENNTTLQIQSNGDNRSAIMAQSIGGGGGNGSLNVSAGIAHDGIVNVGIGGFGSAGGDAGDVNVSVTADLFAAGNMSRGLLAQSIGGGGGAGAINIAGGFQYNSEAKEPVLSFGLGGGGGGGGAAGDVTSSLFGNVMIEGQDSVGALVQSIAGGGGSGGLNVTVAGTIGNDKSIALGAGIGGMGGDGDDAGDVSFTNTGNILVGGEFVLNSADGRDFVAVDHTGGGAGVIVQSIGGGGGTGGINVTGAASKKGSVMSLGVGGSGGSGGHGGAVSVSRGWNGTESAAGLIETYGAGTQGLVAQSIGGGGGNAGHNLALGLKLSSVDSQQGDGYGVLMVIGGSGAGAGSGDKVDVNHNGTIVTHGNLADGIIAQSIGGGGGNGAFNIGGAMFNKAKAALNVAIGGATGAAGSGDTVDVNHRGTVYTEGDLARGIIAQSIGGGGGNSGTDMAVGIFANHSLSTTIGRKGGTGGTGGEVTVNILGKDSRVITTGDYSDGVLAQSIGGGGGTSGVIAVSGSTRESSDKQSKGGGISIGLDGGTAAVSSDVNVNNEGTIYTGGDEARGILAQSIGGGGGIGGSASATLVFAGSGAWLAVGAEGGSGAESGDVHIKNTGLIETAGHSSDGILAQAIGGGGGLGGSTRTIGFQISGSKGDAQNTMTLSFGGSGGEGAIGGQVFVDNIGRILTAGESAYGIRAQSIGGGGGIGGSAVAATIQGKADNNALELNVGGFGGEGGKGDLVEVTNTGLIYTKGDYAAGIGASSIGGGGGEGGLVFSLTALAAPDDDAHRIVANIGGNGGEGGTGGKVTVRNTPADKSDELSGVIMTEGDQAYGILAQSIGGGGGRGSSVINLQGGISSKISTIVGFSLGGQGGDGNYGGHAEVFNDGLIYTQGADAYGILAQSIGGGGGNGGMAVTVNATVNPDLNLTENPLQSPVASIGGFGGDGGGGGLVEVTNTGNIVTTGTNAHGIVAQSIGGGGGNANVGFGLGGLSASGGVSTVLSNAIAFGLGNLGGGSGGVGGQVKVNHSGDITVLGDGAVAIKAESINGGGGSLVMDLAGIVGLPGIPYVGMVGLTPREDPLIAFRVGGIGATSMNASKVSVVSSGTFQTAGDNAIVDHGLSLAGGGGTTIMNVDLADVRAHAGAKAMGFDIVLGGMNGVDNVAADIGNTHSGDLVSAGDASTGVLTQSIGGGGGLGVFNISTKHGATMADANIALGAANTVGERAGSVVRTNTGAVVTTGEQSFASVLQSIGGGGGSAIVDLSVAHDGLGLSLGANAGSGADGNNVSADFTGGTQTTGQGAVGLLMQSIGAGGGELRVNAIGQTTVNLGGTGGVSGNAGSVDLSHTGNLITSGARAHGLVLQSIGGGGGAVFGTDADTGVNLSADNSGNGGAIRFDQSGNIVVSGQDSYGIIAQSLGGGGGWVDGVFAGSAGGRGAGATIDLEVDGIVYVTGLNSTAIFAQSEGADGAGDINLSLSDVVRGGAGSGAGISLLGGANNRIVTNSSLSAVSSWAIRATGGNDHVTNNGMVAGNIDLGGGDNRFMNSQGASFLAFNTIALGSDQASTQGAARTLSLVPQSVSATGTATPDSAGTFTNAGLFRVGLEGSAAPLDLSAGETFDDLDLVAAAEDNIYLGARVITQVDLDGNFVQTETGRSVFDVAFGPYASDRVNVTGDAVIAGAVDINLIWLENADRITLFSTGGEGIVNDVELAGTLALDFTLVGGAEGIQMDVDSHFGLDHMRPNEQALGDHMDSGLEHGGATGIGRLMTALGNMVAGQEDLYQSIFTELNPEGHVAAMQTQYFGATSFANQMFGCDVEASDKGMCVWGEGSTTAFDQEADGDYWGATSRIFNARFGMQRRLNADWSVALSGGYNSLARQTLSNGRMNTQGDGFDVGLGAARRWSQGTELLMTATAGWQWLESQRYGYVFDVMHAKSEGQNGYAQLGAELGHTIRAGDFFIRPAFNAQATALRAGAYQEYGWDGLGARVVSDTQWIGAFEPKVTSGWAFNPAEGVRAGIELTAGRVHRTEDGITLPIQLVGTKRASVPALISTPLDASAWKLGFEAKVVTDSGVAFRAGYDGQLGDKAEVHTGSVSVRWTF